MVFLIGGIIAIIGIGLAVIVLTSLNSSYGAQAAATAEATAQAGIEDALIQLARDNSVSRTGGYSVTTGSSTATVYIGQNAPSSGLVTVTSTATVSNHTRTFSIVLSEDSTTGQTKIISWKNVQ